MATSLESPSTRIEGDFLFFGNDLARMDLMRRFYFLGSIILALLIAASGCKSPVPQGNITDDLGRTVQIKGIPQRIVSLSPSNTEIVYALGLEDRLIGVTTYCNYPPEAQKKDRKSVV